MSSIPSGAGTLPDLQHHRTQALINRLRNQLRDFGLLNRLTDGEENSDAQIYEALMQALEDWNEMTAPFTQFEDVATFPLRGTLLIGARAYLLESVALLVSRNSLAYSDGGIQVGNDSQRYQELMSHAQYARGIFTQKAQDQKYALNVSKAMGQDGLFSEYVFTQDPERD